MQVKAVLLLSACLAYSPIAYGASFLGQDLSQFSVFAGVGGVTNTPTEYPAAGYHTTLSDSLGTTNTTDSGVTGFWGAKQYTGPGIVANNTSSTKSGNPYIHQADTLAASAYSQLISAQAALEAMTPTQTLGDMSGMTLKPGVYSITAPAYNLAVNATLILDGAGYINPSWVFLASSSLIMETTSTVLLINADAGASVYWDAVSSVTLDVGATMVGNILAQTSITMLADASISCGRALDGSLAGGGDVTMSSNTIASSNCSGTAGGLDNDPNKSLSVHSSQVPISEPGTASVLLVALGVLGLVVRGRKPAVEMIAV